MSASSLIERLGLRAETRAPLCRPGDTCWVRLPARRVAFLVDAEAYYAALHDTLLAARKRIWIVGWDVHARTPLRPDAEDRGEPGPFLDSLARHRRGLRIHILEWDYSMLLAGERGLAPWIDLDWRTHPRVKFLLDDRHPMGACVHEKIVVVDDTVAFVGGLDLTVRRWDSSEHRAEDPRRVDPSGKPYEPFHDVQTMVEGDVARAIAERVRYRWNEVSGARVRRLPWPEHTPWPRTASADVKNVDVGVARTEPAPSSVREIERLYLESIRSARESIYVENQYFSAESVGNASASGSPSRTDRGGPGPSERLLGLDRGAHDGARRARQLEHAPRGRPFRPLPRVCAARPRRRTRQRPRQADDRGRRARPDRVGEPRDALARARSRMRPRTRVAWPARRLAGDRAAPRAPPRRAPRRRAGALRGGVPESGNRSLIGAIEALRQGPRTLRPLEACADSSSGWLALPVDPAESSEWLELLARWTPEELRESSPAGRAPRARRRARLRGARRARLGRRPGRSTPPRRPDRSGRRARRRVGRPALPTRHGALAVRACDARPRLGRARALSGALAGAAAGWSLGRYWIGGRIERIAPARIAAFRRRLRQRSVLEIAAVRLAPALPFTIGNLAAGAARVRLPEFLLGTALSLLPYWAVLAAVFAGVRTAWREPGLATAASALLATLASAAALTCLRRWSRRRCAP